VNPPADNSPDSPPRADASSLLPEVYAELRALAAARLRGEGAGHTLQPTALVHEVYLKLARQSRAQWKDTGHFFAVAAQALRRVLVDHARGRRAAKRGGMAQRLTISTELDAAPEEVDLLALDEVLDKLARLSPRQAQVVEMRFFGGMEVTEVARVLEVSESTIKGEWRMARAWLQQQLGEGAQDAGS
jgi:RNA polymerase sigma factor (TIGR02999 family)